MQFISDPFGFILHNSNVFQTGDEKNLLAEQKKFISESIDSKVLIPYFDSSANAKCWKIIKKLKLNDGKLVIGFVICSKCNVVFKYHSEVGNRHLNRDRPKGGQGGS